MQVCVPVDAGAGLSPVPPADAAHVSAAADRDEPEEPAPPQGGGFHARRAGGRPLPERDRRGREDRREERPARRSCARARSTTSSPRTGASTRSRDVAILRLEQQYPFPHAELREQLAKFPERERDRLVPGGAAEPGRVVPAARLLPRRRAAEPGRRLRRAVRSSATTAVGYMSKHVERQKKLIEDAFARAALRRRDAGPHLTGSAAMRVEVKVPQLPESVAEATLV